MGVESFFEEKETEICECPCHREEHIIMHCIPCCTYCDEIYLDKDGKLLPVEWDKTIRKWNKNGK